MVIYWLPNLRVLVLRLWENCQYIYTVWCNQLEQFLWRCRLGQLQQGIKRIFSAKYIGGKYAWPFIMMILIIHNIIVALKPNFMIFFAECCMSLNMHFLQSLLNFKSSWKSPKSVAFSFIWSKMLYFIPIWHVKAVHDKIYAKTVPIWLHHTVYMFRFSASHTKFYLFFRHGSKERVPRIAI